MGFKIVKDYLEVGRTGATSSGYEGGTTIKVRTYDDDGDINYLAVCDDDEDVSAEQFHDWSMADVGSTNSTIQKGNEKAKPFIG